MNPHPPRQDHLHRFVAANGLDGFAVTNPVNVSYLTGFSGDSSYLLVGKERVLLASDGRYETQLKEECPGLAVHIRPPSQKIGPAAAEQIAKLGWRKVGIESGHVTIQVLGQLADGAPAVEWMPTDDVIESARAIKDASEIAEIREAIAIAERAFARLRLDARATHSEKQLADRMEMLLREEGAKCSSFPTIIAGDRQAALPHAPQRTEPLAGCELVLVDWGASVRYKSDLTRTLPTSRITAKFEEVHAAVLRAQERAIARIRPGVRCCDVDAEARAALDEAGFGKFFSHGLGHGLGRDIHEAPWLRPANEAVLQAGMVCTVEPGVYLPDWGGIRIEDDVLVTPDGCEVLTHVTKEPRALQLGF